jgi:hypothetical protein
LDCGRVPHRRAGARRTACSAEPGPRRQSRPEFGSRRSYSGRRLGATSGAGPDARRPEVLSRRPWFRRNSDRRVIGDTVRSHPFGPKPDLTCFEKPRRSAGGLTRKDQAAEETQRLEPWPRCPIFWQPLNNRHSVWAFRHDKSTAHDCLQTSYEFVFVFRSFCFCMLPGFG